MTTRHYSWGDYICLNVDQAVRALFSNPRTTDRPYPAAKEPEPLLTIKQRQHSAALMRINHAGEVCAQALYHGQIIAARSPAVKAKLQQAALEEGDHLAWCSQRLFELGSHTSYLNPLWYSGSWGLGFVAGLAGDQWSLGFLAETEDQVVQHLTEQLKFLPPQDHRSYAILQTMQFDEAKHNNEVIKLGAKNIPTFIKKLMWLISKTMIKTAYWF
jgi:ubiquinone biosynthesis monooxygenase Coq7